MPNKEFLRSFPWLWLHPSVDRSYEVRETSPASPTGFGRAPPRQGSIGPSLITCVFPEQQARVHTGDPGEGGRRGAGAARVPLRPAVPAPASSAGPHLAPGGPGPRQAMPAVLSQDAANPCPKPPQPSSELARPSRANGHVPGLTDTGKKGKKTL